MTYPTKNDNAKAICHPRWNGWSLAKKDPCDDCPLNKPCIKDQPTNNLSIETFTKWIDGINSLADKIKGQS